MEERMLDEEYGRGVRLKKTKDGYVDATDELADCEDGEETEEIAFAFPPDENEDEEDFAELTAEEVAALKKRRAEEAAAKKAEYDRLCSEGDAFLASGSYKSAELKFERALRFDDEATDASVGYWRAKTADFTQPDVLAEEYANESIESLEYDLGYAATDVIRERYESVFQNRIDELTAEETPLKEKVESAQTRRRTILKARLKTRGWIFGVSAIPALLFLGLALFFGMRIFTTKGNDYIAPTIAFAAAFVVFFIVFAICSNRFLNGLRMYRKNERIEETEEGERLLEIQALKKIYEGLLPIVYEDETEENEENAETSMDEA